MNSLEYCVWVYCTVQGFASWARWFINIVHAEFHDSLSKVWFVHKCLPSGLLNDPSDFKGAFGFACVILLMAMCGPVDFAQGGRTEIRGTRGLEVESAVRGSNASRLHG